MKRKIFLLLLAAILAFSTLGSVAFAESNTNSTSYTATLSVNGDVVVSQDAYLPKGTFLNLGLQNAQDLFVQENMMYVADSGSKRVLRVNLDTDEVLVVGSGILSDPRGVSADAEGKIYVADAGNNAAYRFSDDGALEFTFEKPTAPSFGKNTGFKPVKIAPAAGGGVYILSEGATSGLLHISGFGEFLGYFASNDVDMTVIQKIINTVLTEEQKSMFLKTTPPSFGNIFRGDDGLVYTINMGLGAKLKKHSINGLNMFSKLYDMPTIDNPVDIHISSDGRMYIIDMMGRITEITPDGYLLCWFGGKEKGADTSGLFQTPSGIGVDGENNIYVLDRDKNIISVFEPTPVQSSMHRAMNYYQLGLYSESQGELDSMLKFNNTSFFGHIYSAKNSMQIGDYETAAEHFKIANSKMDYSESYWEIRNIWLQKNLVYLILLALILVAIVFILKLVNRKTKVFSGLQGRVKSFANKKFIFDAKRTWYAMMHPIDNAYDVKMGTVGSYKIAHCIYFALFLLVVLNQIASGFMFSVDITEYSVFNTFVAVFSLLMLFLTGNYLISSINDGRGTFKSIYINVAYAFSPVLIFMPFVIIVSNFSTIDERFFIDVVVIILILWSLINVFVGLIEVHSYTFSGAVKNVLLTLFFVGIAILSLSVGYLLVKQIFTFLFEVVVEVSLRV